MSVTRVITGKVRLSYPALFTPKAVQEGGTPKYSASLLVPKTDIATINNINAAIAAATEQGRTGPWKGAVPPNMSVTFYDGDGVQPNTGAPWGEECKGHYIVRASSQRKPQVIDMAKQPIIDPDKIYAGCYVYASVNWYPYNSGSSRGISAGLENILFAEDGEAFAGGVAAEDDFAAILGANAQAMQQQLGQQPQQATPQTYAQQPMQQAAGAFPGAAPQQATGYAPTGNNGNEFM